jgi:hypothetical protein
MPHQKPTSISLACAPAAGTPQSNPRNSRIWSLTQMGSGMAGQDARIISCVFERLTDEQGNFRGEIPYAVSGDIQTYPPLSALLKSVEWRAAGTINQITGLLYRKLPSPNGFSSSWLTSGEAAMHALVGNWGRVLSDRHTSMYRFEALHLSGYRQPRFPDIDELIDELLSDYVIDRVDHPVLERLLKPPVPSMATTAAPFSPTLEDDDDEIY